MQALAVRAPWRCPLKFDLLLLSSWLCPHSHQLTGRKTPIYLLCPHSIVTAVDVLHLLQWINVSVNHSFLCRQFTIRRHFWVARTLSPTDLMTLEVAHKRVKPPHVPWFLPLPFPNRVTGWSPLGGGGVGLDIYSYWQQQWMGGRLVLGLDTYL